MKRIFEGKVYEVLPQQNSIVFSYYKGMVENQTSVFFKMYSFDNGELSQSDNNVYWISKFGANFQQAVKFCDNYIEAKVVHLDKGRMFISNANGRSFLLDGNAKPTWVGDVKYRGKPLSDVALYGNSIWAAFSDFDTLLRLNEKTLREELRVGKKGCLLNGPSALFVEGNTAFVCSKGGNKIVSVNLDTFDIKDKYYFEEPVLSYTKVLNHEFVVLESGLYQIN